MSPKWFRWDGGDLELVVQVHARSPNEGLGEILDEAVKVRVRAPPAEGRANRRLAEVLAEAFGVAGSRVSLVNGARSRRKRVRIERPRRFPEPLRSDLERGRQVDQTGKAV